MRWAWISVGVGGSGSGKRNVGRLPPGIAALPEFIIGVELTGKTAPGITSTILVIALTAFFGG